MSLARNITLNTLSQVIGRAGVIVVSLLTTAILTRHLGKDGYGAFGVINTAVVMFFSFADWGTNLMAVRESSRSSYPLKTVLGNCLLVRSAMALVVVLFFWFFVFLNSAFITFRTAALLSGFIILFMSFKTSAQIIFHSQLKLHLASLVDFVSAVLFFVFLLFVQELTLLPVISLLAASAFLAALLALFMAVRMVKVDFHLHRSFLKRWLKESLPMGALLAVYSVYNRIDTFMLQSLQGEGPTGLYILAYKFHDNLILGAAYLMNSLFPVLANFSQRQKDSPSLERILQKAFDCLLVLALPMVVIIYWLAPWLIKLLGGQEFLPATQALRVLVLATGIGYLNHLTGYSLVALGRQRTHLKFGILALFLNILLNLLFIPIYSFVGASVVTVLTELLIFVLTFSYLKRRLGIELKFNSFPQTIKQLVKNPRKYFIK